MLGRTLNLLTILGNIMEGKLILLHFNEIDSAKEMRYALLENEKVKKKHLSLKSMGH